MNLQIVESSYQWGYVALSFAFAVIGSLVALTSASRIRQSDGSVSVGSILAAGLALGGVGVWSMHFIGMLALQLEVPSSYALTETLVSLVAAVVGSALAFGFVAAAPHQGWRLLLAGFLLGMGVVVMHYLGMHGMRIDGYVRWDFGLVALSAVIAVVAATAALWLAFHVDGLAARGGAALVMGVAVCAMHYTGMGAAEFICTTPGGVAAAAKGDGFVSAALLPNIVAVAAMSFAAMITVYQAYQASMEGVEELEAGLR